MTTFESEGLAGRRRWTSVRPYWTKWRIIRALDEWHSTNLRAPAAREWWTAGDSHPSYWTVRAVFGSWKAALEAARRPDRAACTCSRPNRLSELRQIEYACKCTLMVLQQAAARYVVRRHDGTLTVRSARPCEKRWRARDLTALVTFDRGIFDRARRQSYSANTSLVVDVLSR